MLEWIASNPWTLVSLWTWSALMIALGWGLNHRLQKVMRALQGEDSRSSTDDGGEIGEDKAAETRLGYRRG